MGHMKTLGLVLCIAVLSQASLAGDSPTIGLQAGVLDFIGKAPSVGYGYVGEAHVKLPVSNKLSLGLVSGFGQQKFSHPEGNFTTQLLSLDLCGIYKLRLAKWLQPYALLGTGAINFKRGDWPNFWDASAIAGGGVDIMVGANVGFRVAADYRYTSGKDFDGVSGGENDSYMTAKAGLHFSFTPGKKEEPREESLASSDLLDLLINDVGARKKNTAESIPEQSAISSSTSAESQRDDWITRDKSKQISDFILAAQENGPRPEPVIAENAAEPVPEPLDKGLEERQKLIEQLKKELEAKNRRLAMLQQLKEKPAAIGRASEISNYKQEYDKGLALFNQQNFDEAKIVFESLLKAEPMHRLSSNCQYWVGECAFATGQFEKAIDAFEKTLQYPNSPKTDDALIMLGLAYRRLGQNQKANQYFVRLLTEFQDSEYVPLARKFASVDRYSYSEF